MTPFTVVAGAGDEGTAPALRLRDDLRGRDVPCVLLVELAAGPAEVLVRACAALAAAGIATVVLAAPERAADLLTALRRELDRVAAALPSPDTTVADLRDRGWLPAEDEPYTEDELDTVTARLRDLGYA